MRTPAISVVIPSRRGPRLARALQALAAQTLPADRFEVIVVQDPESVGPPERPAGVRVTWLRADRVCGPAAKRNLGWSAASAELVAFTDDDCEPTPEWLERLVEAAGEAPGAVLQGRTTPIPRELDRLGPFSRTLTVEGPNPWFATCNVAYPAALLRALDGFDEEFTWIGGEDTDLAWRAREAGAPDLFVAEAHVHHAVEVIGPAAKLRVAARWYPAFRVFRRHPGLRDGIYLRLFWKRSHARLLLGLAGLMLARRFPPALALALPYARELRGRMASERAPLSAAPYYPLHDAVEILTAARGSLAHGILVL